MKFDVYGNKDNPVIVMLPGSFCPGEALEYLYTELCKDYYVIVTTYNGAYKDSKDFTTRQNEAKEITDFIINEKINTVKMIYGQSMGAEISAELGKQLLNRKIEVQNMFFDGAPMIRLSKAYKTFMYFKFSTMLNFFKKKDIDGMLNMRFVKQLGGDKINSLKTLIESIVKIAPHMNKHSVKNQVECCYSFDFPEFSEDMQKGMYFFYGTQEKAYKTCIKRVRKEYPKASYILKEGHGHMTYSVENFDEYVKILRNICSS